VNCTSLIEERLQHRQHCFDAVDRLDDVGARLTLDYQNDGLLFVVPGGEPIVFRPIDRFAEILDPHRRPVAVGEDQIVIGARIEQLIIGVERVALARAVERAFRQIDVGLTDHVANVLETDAARGQRLRIDLNADRWLLLTPDSDQADAGDLRDLLHQNVFRIGINNGDRQGVRREGKDEDRRIGRIHFADRRRIRHV